MKIVISGSSGLIGSRIAADLESSGVEVVRLVRPTSEEVEGATARWHPAEGELDPTLLAGADAVINLNGRSIAGGRWTTEVKRQLRSSRIDPTRTLADAIGSADPPPRVLINASASGYYGDRGEDELDEGSPPGSGFLAELTREWEQEAARAASESTRAVMLRFGMVIAEDGALGAMLTPFKLGLGGPIGSGRQWWPWIAIEDVVGVVRFALETSELAGPVNVVSPQAVRCREFTSTLGRVLGRPAVLPLPAFAARLMLGEMADELLLASAKIEPAILKDLGYSFRIPEIEASLRRATD